MNAEELYEMYSRRIRLHYAIDRLENLNSLASLNVTPDMGITFDPPTERTDMKTYYAFENQVVALDVDDIVAVDEHEEPLEQGRMDRYADIVLAGGAKIRVDLNTDPNRDTFKRIMTDWGNHDFQFRLKEAV